MAEFWKTLKNGYCILFNEAKDKFNEHGPKALTGIGTSLMVAASALIARESCKGEVQQALQEAEAELQKVKESTKEEKNVVRTRKILKAKVKKGLKIAKVYRSALIADAIGAACIGAGIGMSESGRHKAIAGAAAIGSAFAEYRAAVRSDLGEDADIKYMRGDKAVNALKKPKKKGQESEPEIPDSMTITKDPGAFKLLFSKENTPSVWSDNYDMRISNLEWIECVLSRAYINTWGHGGYLTLNDMRREFDAVNPRKFDVPIGGVFGRKYEKDNPETHKLVNLHFRDDEDFMSGRKDWCWIIFDCDPEPIICRDNKQNFKSVEG